MAVPTSGYVIDGCIDKIEIEALVGRMEVDLFTDETPVHHPSLGDLTTPTWSFKDIVGECCPFIISVVLQMSRISQSCSSQAYERHYYAYF